MSLASITKLSAGTGALMAVAVLFAGTATAQSYMPYRAQFYATSRDYTPNHAVFLRAGPTTDAPIIGVLRPGMPLRVTASANYGWMRVQSPEGTGWTYGSYLAPG